MTMQKTFSIQPLSTPQHFTETLALLKTIKDYVSALPFIKSAHVNYANEDGKKELRVHITLSVWIKYLFGSVIRKLVQRAVDLLTQIDVRVTVKYL